MLTESDGLYMTNPEDVRADRNISVEILRTNE